MVELLLGLPGGGMPWQDVWVEWEPPMLPGTSVGQDTQVSPMRPPKKGGPPSSRSQTGAIWTLVVVEACGFIK